MRRKPVVSDSDHEGAPCQWCGATLYQQHDRPCLPERRGIGDRRRWRTGDGPTRVFLQSGTASLRAWQRDNEGHASTTRDPTLRRLCLDLAKAYARLADYLDRYRTLG